MKMFLVLIMLLGFVACKSKDSAPVDVQPTPTLMPPVPTATPAPKKGHIEIHGDFSPACPGIPGFVAPKVGDECELGFRACSGGAVYVCVE